jgi:dihydrofolate reductase
MRPLFFVFIATSLDGFIARTDGTIDWLHEANALVPAGEDCGYEAFMASIDALLLGRKTYETVLTFDEWPYGDKAVYVLSDQLTSLAPDVPDTARLIRGSIPSIVDQLRERGHRRVYVDGGSTIQSFLAAGLVDELTITRIPVLLGSGRPLFAPATSDLVLQHVSTRVYPFGFVQSTYAVQANRGIAGLNRGAECARITRTPPPEW